MVPRQVPGGGKVNDTLSRQGAARGAVPRNDKKAISGVEHKPDREWPSTTVIPLNEVETFERTAFFYGLDKMGKEGFFRYRGQSVQQLNDGNPVYGLLV